MSLNNQGVGVYFDVAVQGLSSLKELNRQMGFLSDNSDMINNGIKTITGLQFAERISNVGEQFKQTGIKVTQWGSRVIDSFTESVKSGMMSLIPFESRMTSLKATTGMTNKEVQELTESMMLLAEATPFESEQVFATASNFAMLGINLKNTMYGAVGMADAWEEAEKAMRTLNPELTEFMLKSEEQKQFFRETFKEGYNAVAMFGDFATTMGFVGERYDRFLFAMNKAMTSGSVQSLDELPAQMRKAIFGTVGTLKDLKPEEIIQKMFQHVAKKGAIGAATAASTTLEGYLTGFKEFRMKITRQIMGLPGSGGIYDKMVLGIGKVYTAFDQFFKSEAVLKAISSALVPILDLVIQLADVIVWLTSGLQGLVEAAPWLMKPIVWGTLVVGALAMIIGSLFTFSGTLLIIIAQVATLDMALKARGGTFKTLAADIGVAISRMRTLAAGMTGIKALAPALSSIGATGAVASAVGAASPTSVLPATTQAAVTAAMFSRSSSSLVAANKKLLTQIPVVSTKLGWMGTKMKFLSTWTTSAGKYLFGLITYLKFFMNPVSIVIGLLTLLGIAWSKNTDGIQDYAAAALNANKIPPPKPPTRESKKPPVEEIQEALTVSSAFTTMWNGFLEGFEAGFEHFRDAWTDIGPVFGILVESFRELLDTILRPMFGESENISGEMLTWAQIGRAVGVAVSIIARMLAFVLNILMAALITITKTLTWTLDLVWDLGYMIGYRLALAIDTFNMSWTEAWAKWREFAFDSILMVIEKLLPLIELVGNIGGAIQSGGANWTVGTGIRKEWEDIIAANAKNSSGMASGAGKYTGISGGKPKVTLSDPKTGTDPGKGGWRARLGNVMDASMGATHSTLSGAAPIVTVNQAPITVDNQIMMQGDALLDGKPIGRIVWREMNRAQRTMGATT